MRATPVKTNLQRQKILNKRGRRLHHRNASSKWCLRGWRLNSFVTEPGEGSVWRLDLGVGRTGDTAH